MLCGDLEHSDNCRVFWYCRGIKFKGVKEVICKMRWGRAIRRRDPGGILENTEKGCMEGLTGLFNVIFRTSKMPEE